MFSTAQNTQRDSQSREEKGEGGDRDYLGEKKESQKGERAIKPVITLLSKNEDWILKGTELITNTKKKRLKIYSRGHTLKIQY